MLDVHVIVGTARVEWLAQCLSSVVHAMAIAPFPMALHVVPGEAGHIGRGRARGYAAGTFPYVTFVDDDDYVLPGAFAQMAEAFRQQPSAICTPELVEVNGNPLIRGGTRHHLTAIRRKDVIDHAAWAACGDVAQAMAIPGDAVELTEPGYVHRVYADSPARVLRRHHPGELKVARGG